ncbi:MAG: 50S ribosomal protein L32 [Candidatus Magasanikbacteria bacterium]|jgi:ribosomal protein L32|nr:50S ribosomal protein L32 [Candidatus Magasanikbacteria bacterium]MBT5262917.1 50S ribosomal protein L32 [Candidatus Magasanikbacteria bacterium]MBT5820178.1 50S ribosomal protein L32 [Candidatus Magasanikbacteria bacterium]MBT6294927.1 50S ribosomal protein L32 [Candidatus Magasanikbacteria bacterium]
MCTPKGKNTSSSRRTRRSHIKHVPLQIQLDAEGNPHQPHVASPVSGMYKGRVVVDVQKRHARRMRKLKRFA